MKEIAKKIYENNFYLYGLGFVSALFFLFLSYRDLADFITREAVVGYSLLTVLLTAGLLLNEAGNYSKTESEVDYQEENSTQTLQPTQLSQEPNEIEEEDEKVIYEWEEEEFEEEVPPAQKNKTPPAKKELV